MERKIRKVAFYAVTLIALYFLNKPVADYFIFYGKKFASWGNTHNVPTWHITLLTYGYYSLVLFIAIMAFVFLITLTVMIIEDMCSSSRKCGNRIY